MQDILKKVTQGQNLTSEEAGRAMTDIMTGQAGEVRTAALLAALVMKGETGQEIEAFARSMRKAAVPWPGADEKILCDTCGTGGDSSRTINVSTITAILLAAMGVPITKHGNRAVSGLTGSADLLESLGIPVELDPESSLRCLQKVGICFLFAPKWHPAMKYAAPVRKAMGIRTVFNLLGPITNPAPVTHQVIGVFHERFMDPLAHALSGLARRGAYIVHSRDGLDEVSISAPTSYVKIENGEIVRRGEFQPEDFGFSKSDIANVQVESRDEALERARIIFAGKGNDVENALVSMNAALIYNLVSANGAGSDLKKAARECLDALKSGKCEKVIGDWKSFENESGTVVAMG